MDAVEVPVAGGSRVFYNGGTFQCPAHAVATGSERDFGTQEIAQMKKIVKKYLFKQVRGMRCERAGGHISEFNFRRITCHGKNANEMKDEFIKQMKDVQGQLFQQLTQ